MLVFVDTETGGLNPEDTSLLSIAFAIYKPESQSILNKLELLVRHDPYQVSAGALNTNGINLVEHHQRAYQPKQCIEMIQEFLYPFFKETQAKLAGHNAPFDVGYIKRMFSNEKQSAEYDKLFSHRVIDTIPIAQVLKDAGKLPLSNLGLSNLVKHFGITLDGDRHTAMADCLATVAVYQKLTELVQGA